MKVRLICGCLVAGRACGAGETINVSGEEALQLASSGRIVLDPDQHEKALQENREHVKRMESRYPAPTLSRSWF